MLDHIYISVSDVPRSLAFYAAALAPLGWRKLGCPFTGSLPRHPDEARCLKF